MKQQALHLWLICTDPQYTGLLLCWYYFLV